MQTPQRRSPIQGIIISNSKPIFIDSEEPHRYTRQQTTISTISKLPAFEPDDKLTKILYSKFLVKGVKPINSAIMISKLKKQTQTKQNSKNKKKSPNLSKQRIIVTDLNCSNTKLKPQSKIQKQTGIFQITKDHYDRAQKSYRPQTAFQRSHSLNQLNRPQSAAIRQSSSQKKIATRPQSGDATTKMRSMTAISRSNSVKKYTNNRFQLGEQSENVRPILTITDDWSNLRNVNYIEKNRRQASLKRQNGYITEVEVSTLNKRKQSKQKQQQKHSNKIDVNFDRNLIRQRVTAQQKREIKEKHKQYLNYLKENQPQQYAECLNYLLSLDQNGNKAENSIFDMGFNSQDDFFPSSKEIQQEQIKNFYQNFYNICLDVEYGIKKATKKQIKIPQKSSNLLNIYECQQLLAIYAQIQSLRSFHTDYSLKLQRIKQIIKNLQFFRELKPEIISNLLSMQFRIQLFPEKIEVIQEDSQIRQVYIILNGSVSKKNKQEQDITQINQHKIPQFLTTLFDGQVFGLPSKPQEKVLHYSIKTLQRSLLMIFPYCEYRKALSSNQNIEDRISLLQQIIKGNNKLAKEDLQLVAFQMEGSTFSAQQIIYREGDNCSKLLLIAGGKVTICYEYFITRPKKNLDPLRKSRNQKVPNFKILAHRRKNLRNYEVVHESAESMTYYYCEAVEERVRGDVMNWQGFYNKALPQFICDEDFVHRIPHSIVSVHDNTRVYQMAPEKMETLPQHIFQAFFDKAQTLKGKESFKRNEKQSNKWEKFKHSLVASILSTKHSK